MESRFPDPRAAPADAPLAWGGSLDPDTLVDAYSHGIFPWPAGDEGVCFWWSPDPRAVLPLDGFHASRSLLRSMRRRAWTYSRDLAFDRVIAACTDRPGTPTWITPEMLRAYRRLHRLGLAHSVEVWHAGRDLVGGVYGVALGAAFMGESMFHRQTDASKAALAHLVGHLRARGFVLFDVQLPTDHLRSLGAVTVPRKDFLVRLDQALRTPASF